MRATCEYQGGCEKPGLYTIPTQEVIPLSIRVCAAHRAMWVESLERRTRWPCAVKGCRRVAVQDGLCEACWTVVRAHDALMLGEMEPALRRVAVRHVARPIIPDKPSQDDIETAAKTADTLRTLVRSAAALAGRAPVEYRDDLEEAARLLAEVARHAALLAKVELEARPEQPQQVRFL